MATDTTLVSEKTADNHVRCPFCGHLCVAYNLTSDIRCDCGQLLATVELGDRNSPWRRLSPGFETQSLVNLIILYASCQSEENEHLVQRFIATRSSLEQWTVEHNADGSPTTVLAPFCFLSHAMDTYFHVRETHPDFLDTVVRLARLYNRSPVSPTK